MEAAERKIPTVLCIDDEQSILNAVERLLKTQGMNVVTSLSGERAAELIAQHHVDVVLCDMRMPTKSGALVLKEVYEQTPSVYRILMTGYSDVASTAQAINEGKIHRYIQKPWDNNELVSAIKEGIRVTHLESANQRLQKQIQKQNAELKTLNEGLEIRVRERTQQLKKTLAQLKKSLALVKDQKLIVRDALYASNVVVNGRVIHFFGFVRMQVEQ